MVNSGFFISRLVRKQKMCSGGIAAALIVWVMILLSPVVVCAEKDNPEIPTADELIESLERDRDQYARSLAAWWLGEQANIQGVNGLIRTLNDDRSALVRTVAAWALGEIRDVYAVDALIHALEDNNVYVREMAILSLGEIEHPAAIEPLIHTFDLHEDMRGAIVWALGEIEGRKAEFARREAFARWGVKPFENDEVWTGKLGGMWHDFPESHAVDDLFEELKSRSANRRRLAAVKLGFLGMTYEICRQGQYMSAVQQLISHLHDESPEVRAAAVWALDEINPSECAQHRSDSGQKAVIAY